MPPKKASDSALERELADAVRRIYNSEEREQLTVNYARQAVQKKLGLPDGFFKSDAWKERSKEIILSALNEAESALLSSLAPKDEPQPTPKKKAPKKATTKNGAARVEPAKKKTKKEPTPDEKSDSESSLSSLSEIVPKPKKRKLAAGRGKKKMVDSDEEESPESSEDEFVSSSEDERPKKKAKPTARKPKKKPHEKVAVDSDTESPLSEPDSESEGAGTEVRDSIEASESKPTKAEPDHESKLTKAGSDNESEMSVVRDEPPKRKSKPQKSKTESASKPEDGGGSDTSEVFDEPLKRKGKGKDEPVKRGPKAQPAIPAEQSPDDALIKQLQGQLVKCGVRKIWGVELKKYGDDKKGKIRHLKNMLTEIGMTGRFSEAKAKEIKERRELMADLDAVMEGEKNWGVNQGRPVRRRVVKSLKEPSDEESSEQAPKASKESGSDEDEGDSDGDSQVRRRGPAKRRADLAFLGDESESD